MKIEFKTKKIEEGYKKINPSLDLLEKIFYDFFGKGNSLGIKSHSYTNASEGSTLKIDFEWDDVRDVLIVNGYTHMTKCEETK